MHGAHGHWPAHWQAHAVRAPARSSRQSCAAAICEPVRCMRSYVREVIRTSRGFGTRPRRYRCSLPGLAGFTVGRREGTGTDHRGPLAERVGFEPTNTREDVTGIPVQRLRPLGHLSIQCITGIIRDSSNQSCVGPAYFGGGASPGAGVDGGDTGAVAAGAADAEVDGGGALRQNCHHFFGFGGGFGCATFRGLLK